MLVAKVGPEDYGLMFGEAAGERQIKMPCEPTAYGAALYDSLYHLDRFEPETICVEIPPKTPDWEAVLDRLQKASTAGV